MHFTMLLRMQFSFTNGRQFYNKVKEVFKGIYSTFSTHEARTSALELAFDSPKKKETVFC